MRVTTIVFLKKALPFSAFIIHEEYHVVNITPYHTLSRDIAWSISLTITDITSFSDNRLSSFFFVGMKG
jgi:hypothetical protein